VKVDTKIILDERNKIYDEVREYCNVDFDNGVQLEIKIKNDLFSKLKNKVENYIFVTLKSFYKDKEFIKDNNFLLNYEKDILNLPNRTPSGAFYPKVENIKEYNQVQSVVNDIVLETKYFDTLHSLDICTVRIQDGRWLDTDERPSATTRLHSDAWPGHNGDAITTIGIMGDENTTLEFNKPIGKMSDKFFDTQKSYSDGLNLFEDIELIGNLKFGYLTIFDHACLHRTCKNGKNLRVSIDFGVVTSNSYGCRKDFGEKTTGKLGKNISYQDKNKIIKIGKKSFLKATETLQECYDKYKNDKYDKKPDTHITDNLKIKD
tara:strand:+ start:3436 stop:4392 length:957 start_codon:yes stop_codon:yes gene_type:complete